MMKKINDIRGQTALILILLAAATLIFLAITLNWGRIAQIKSLITVAADQSAAQLASDTASYGEMEKQTYLKDDNQFSESTSVLLAIILVVIAIIVTVLSWGSAGPFAAGLLIAAVAMAVINLVLQVVVVQPMITSLWNKLQQNQPIQQQFFEQGIGTALQGSVTDQVKITDYFDSNANGIFGVTNLTPNDSISRFALFYTDRLKMLNTLLPPIPQVVLFYNQLGELLNGQTCDESVSDASLGLGVALNPICAPLNCASAPADPICTEKIPGSFQLNDACTTSNPGNTTTYNPYCDPCCQPQFVPGSNPPIPLRPLSCASDAECSLNNPYGGAYLDIYDPSFQNYVSGISFLDLMGRDQQMGPFATLTPDVMSPPTVTPPFEFPNGVFPFFWEMDAYSPQVDNINSAALLPSQDHWCTTAVAPPVATPAGFPDLAQLQLAYVCSGADCCVNNVTGSLTASPSVSSNLTITLTGGPVVIVTPPNGSYYLAGSNITINVAAAEPPPGAIVSVTLFNSTGQLAAAASATLSYPLTNVTAGTYVYYAQALDVSGTLVTSTPNTTINVIPPPTVTVGNVTLSGPVTDAANVTLTVTATTSSGTAPDTITSVVFMNNGASIGAGTVGGTGSYSLVWAVPAALKGKAYSLTAVATDQYAVTANSLTPTAGTVL